MAALMGLDQLREMQHAKGYERLDVNTPAVDGRWSMFGLGLRALDIMLMAGGFGLHRVGLNLGWTWVGLHSFFFFMVSPQHQCIHLSHKTSSLVCLT